MKLAIQNIGKIEKAEIDLSKQLTVFFGPNNTGKTYVSYCIYGLFNIDFQLEFIRDSFEIPDNCYDGNVLRVSTSKYILPQREAVKQKFIQRRRFFYKSDYGNYNVSFDEANCYPTFLDSDEAFLNHINYFFKIFLSHTRNTTPFVIDLNDGDLVAKFDKEFFTRNGIEKITDQYNNLKFYLISSIFYFSPSTISNAFFLSVERLAFTNFAKEIGGTRLEKTNNPQEQDKLAFYPRAINDLLVNEIKQTNLKRNTEFNSFATEIEEKILKGKVSLDDYGNVYFSDNDIKNLPILNAASSIKSLASLVLYLRYNCYNGDVLFFDEPEMNLHPENQIKLARILAKLSNKGVKLFLSTHSDYILREFNNLIMLGVNEENPNLYKKLNYNIEEILNFENVGAYHFIDKEVHVQKITKEGFDAPSIDEQISKQNKVFNSLKFELIED